MILNTLQQHIAALIIIILLAFAIAYGLQSTLVKLNESTAQKPVRFKPSL